MDRLTRFSDYDVFAYVASGLGALAVWDIVFGTRYVVDAAWTVANATLVIAGAYIIGHILAAPAKWLLQGQIVHRVLLRPSIVLMEAADLGWRRFLQKTVLQDYYSPLNSGVQHRVRKKAAGDNDKEAAGEALFWRAFGVAKANANAYARMERFLTLYGFCRNLAFVGLLGSCVLSIRAMRNWALRGWSSELETQLLLALFALFIGIGMMHRYLKFFRLYTLEVFLAYSNPARSEVT